MDLLVVSGRRDDAGATVVAELAALGATARFVRSDVAVNNAGTEGTPRPCRLGSRIGHNRANHRRQRR
jgi:hypothetical protein